MARQARRWIHTAALAAMAAAWIGCTSKSAEPLKITAVDLGSAITDEKKVTAAGQTFAPTSTIYASIATDGSGAGTLTARWTAPDGQVLVEQKQTINPTGPAYFEFHHAPAGGWPVGRHKVVLALDGGGARAREFEVR
jgi:hypothetical protein